MTTYPAEEPPPPKVLTLPGGYTRTITARRVNWRCEWCSAEHEEWRYPGPLPRYCEECRRPAQNAMAAGAMRRKRQAEHDAAPYARQRPPGRPRTV